MKKLISLLVSLSLLFASVTPSYAAPGIPPVKMLIDASRTWSTTINPFVVSKVSALPMQVTALTAATARNLTLAQSATALQQIAKLTSLNASKAAAAGVTPEITKQLNLNVVPTLVVNLHSPITITQHQVSVSYYRNLLAENAPKPMVPFTTDKLDLWGQNMSLISNLGFLGTPADAATILSIAEKTPITLDVLSDVVVARALLNLGALDELSQFAAMRAKQGRINTEVWQNIKGFVAEHNLEVTIPELDGTTLITSAQAMETAQVAMPALNKWNELNVRHKDSSAQATLDWLSLKHQQGNLVRDPSPEQTALQQTAQETRAVTPEPEVEPLPVEDLYVPAALTDNTSLSLGSMEIPELDVAVEEVPSVSVSVYPEELKDAYAVAKEKVNLHYANTKYAPAISDALTASFDTALRKYVKRYKETPMLETPAFQELLLSTARHELEKAAKTNKALTKDAQKDVLATLKDSFDPSKEIAPATSENGSIFSNIFGFFSRRKDVARAAKANLDARAAQFAGLEVSFPVDVEISKGVSLPQDISITLKFENDKVKKAFIKKVRKLDSERFVLRTDGALVLRSTSGAERGITGVFFQGGQAAASNLYKILAARQMAPRFAAVADVNATLGLLTEHKEALHAILSKELKAAHPELAKFLASKASETDATLNALKNSGTLPQAVKAVQEELNGIVATNVDTPIELTLFTDNMGQLAQIMTAISEGMSSVGQAITAALNLLGIEKGFLSQLPTSAGQFGPATAPLIGGLQSKIGGKHTLYVGQTLSAVGNAIAMTSLGLGAVSLVSPGAAFLGMISGILINGIAGNGILKQSNVPLAKERANDPISASAIAADLNSWASVGGMYCYLFLPVVGGITSALFGLDVGLGTLAGMFGISTAVPLVSAGLMRASKITNTVEKGAGAGYFKTIGENLKFGFKSSTLKGMMARVAGYHFAGMAFNSGPGSYFKEYFKAQFPNDPTMASTYAMAASFASVYLTVYLGRKIGANMMKNGTITDKALIGLSSLIALGAGTASILPGLDVYTRGALWAAAGLGFANLANMEQAIELNRPANAGHKAAVSTMYVLARMSGMATIAMGALADGLAISMGVDPVTASVYALSLPLLTLAGSTVANWSYIKDELFGTQLKRWTSKAPKALVYSSLRTEVEQAMTKNPAWGTTLATEQSADLSAQVALGISSRYNVSLSTLEEIRMGLEDKAGLDIHRLDMARKLLQRPFTAAAASGEPLTYDAFREEVEPLYTNIVVGRASGMAQADIENMTNAVLDGILAKYTVTQAVVDVIVAKLSRRTAMNRNRLSVLDDLYVLQLQKDAASEMQSQLKNATDDLSKQDIINHVIEKYRDIAKSRGIDWEFPADAIPAF